MGVISFKGVSKLTEKWKHLKIVFPGKVISIHIVRSAAHLAGQSGGGAVLDFKMKSEIILRS